MVRYGCVGRDQRGKILGHGTGLDRIDADLLECLGEVCRLQGVPSNWPRYQMPRVQAKIDAIGLVDVSLPFWCSR